jgi:mannose-6-phosphate isomerase-like protein (cupin superfamily)
MTQPTAGGPQPVLVRADDAETLGVTPTTIQLLIDGDPTSGAVSVARSKLGKGTDGPPPHYHAGSAEIFFIIEGRLHVLAGERVITVGEGDFLLVPPNTAHAFCTPADTGVDLLFIMSGVERFEYFRLGDRVRQGNASPQELLDTQDRFDNHFLDSPAWRQFRGTAPDLVPPPPPGDERHTP